ncbi:YtxH domain-containing protein [Actinomadura roseirufa]|uniref:YtxH domain-containing protein n=1 Tax=Actinomadura roseirufa TaxID=2094049 RepID=UPI001041A485|nr:YtxH domain-containing protein [Actinomadura roseirufa]
MKYRMAFMAGAAIGYVLGTKAGRERYEQIKRVSRQVSENPNVQEAAEVIRGKAGSVASSAKERVPEQIGGKRAKAEQEKPSVQPG